MDGSNKDRYEEVQLIQGLAYDRSEWINKNHVADPNIVGTRLRG